MKKLVCLPFFVLAVEGREANTRSLAAMKRVSAASRVIQPLDFTALSAVLSADIYPENLLLFEYITRYSGTKNMNVKNVRKKKITLTAN
jgi:hypothetical protein